MAAGSKDAVEEALNVLINMTEKSGNLRNDLLKDILGAVSNLRKEFAKLKCQVENKNKLFLRLEIKASGTNSTLRPLEFGCVGDKEATSPGFPVNWKVSDRNVPPSGGRSKKLYSDIVAGSSGNMPHDNKMFKLFVKSKLNPVQIKVGISAFKTLKNGQLLIESERKNDLEIVCEKINELCGEELESYTPSLKSPRLIVFNVPEDNYF